RRNLLRLSSPVARPPRIRYRFHSSIFNHQSSILVIGHIHSGVAAAIPRRWPQSAPVRDSAAAIPVRGESFPSWPPTLQDRPDGAAHLPPESRARSLGAPLPPPGAR